MSTRTAASTATAAPAVRRMRLEDVARIAVPAQPAISPDGGTIVYALTTVDLETDENRSALWRVSTAGGPPTQLTWGAADSSPAWSPDGSRIAFLRKAGDDPAQMWLLPAGPGEPAPLTSLPGGAGAPVWSPDSARIAFTAPVAPADSEPERPIVVDRLGYKRDGVGFWRDRRRHVFVVEPATGETRQLTSGDWHAGAPVWSPDGSRLAFPAAAELDADRTGESAAYVLDLSGDAEPHLVGDPHGIAETVSWTPDGDALLVVGQPEVRAGHQRLLRVPLAGGPTVPLAGELDRNVMIGSPGYPGGLPQFTPDGATLLFCVRDRGCTHLYGLGRDAAPRLVLGGADRVVAGLSVARTVPTAAVIVASPRSYGEVAVLDLDQNSPPAVASPCPAAPVGEETVLTNHALPDVELFEPVEREFTISDGTRVHGWLLRDPAAPTPAPLLVDMHGGPHNAWNPVPSPGKAYRQLLAADGWAVLLLNPRGSDGYGEAFYTAAVGAWGLADEHDFLEPIDALVAERIADPDRLAVTGYSYGGYLTCWLTGRTDRFAAAVTGGPVTDLTSMAGTSDFGHVMALQEKGALPYLDPQQLARLSPYSWVGHANTPTLILQGDADDRCPPGQAEQWFSALRGRGVPAQLVLYPDASHLFLYHGRPSYRVDYSRRLVDWVTHYTRPGARAHIPAQRRRPSSLHSDHWRQRLAELAGQFRVPGAALGIGRGDERVELAHGLTNVDTGVAVTPDTLFQIGSITKVWTTTVVMRLVEAGLLDLDKPVVSYLPELRLADPEVTQRVTMRQLLTHTSGIDGDAFLDVGQGDDCLERYVAALAEIPQNHPLGEGFSYCNAGFSVAGRVIEVLTDQRWDDAMRDRLFAPLGLSRSVTLPEQAMLHRTAVGHVHEAGEPFRRTSTWALPRSSGPVGGMLSSTVGDVLTFARLHLTGGLAPDGTRLLSPGSVTEMQAAQATLPDVYTHADSVGLGWFRMDWGGVRLFGHNGGTLGQAAYLRVLPDHDLALVLLTNGGFGVDLYETLMRELVEELTGVEMAQPVSPAPDAPDVDLSPHAGTYQRTGVRYEVWQEDRPRLRATSLLEVDGLDRPPRELELASFGNAGGIAARTPGEQTWSPLTFGEWSDGTPYLHLALRATPKVS